VHIIFEVLRYIKYTHL